MEANAAIVDESQNAAPSQEPSSSPPPPDQVAEDGASGGDEDEENGVMSKAQTLMEKITSSQENPNPNVLHALASILETQESKYMEEIGHSSINSRSSHNIGRLGNLVRENDEFFELISSKFLSESRYTTSVQAAAMRLLLSCSLTWVYPHVFEETIMENIKNWVMDETSKFSGERGRKNSSDADMLKTYSTGLLAVCLVGGVSLVEDVLTSGLSAKLMRYLRARVLVDANMSQKEPGHVIENKFIAGPTSVRHKEENRSRLRHILGANHLEDSRIVAEGILDDHGVGGYGEECGVDTGEPLDAFCEGIDRCEVNAEGEDRWSGRDFHDGKIKCGDRNGPGRSGREEELDESVRDESRRRLNRGWGRYRGRGRIGEGAVEHEQAHGFAARNLKDRTSARSSDLRKIPDVAKLSGKISADGFALEREDNDDCFLECKFGSKDISDLVKKAVRAAEAEAKAANAPTEAIKAAGDAAAELVKSAAVEEFKATNDEEAAVLAASRAASTVVDAATAVEVSRSSSGTNVDSGITEAETNEEVEDFFILDGESLAQLREKYCIQCLEILGEYVEVLGPVLHEKGVDVCLALLQRNSENKEPSKLAVLLPDVLKLICALAAHRKFASLFVDRGGMQKLLAVPRVFHTYFGLSSCLFTIGSLQGIMERVCALPSDIVHQVVELALQLLECPLDQARKNAALFFAAAFVFRAVVDSFDAQDGMQKLLSLLQDAASVRSGVNSGALGLANSGSIRNDRSPAEVLTSSEKQIAYHTCVALRQYFRAHLLLLVDSIRPNKSSRSVARNVSSIRAAYKPLDISNEATDDVFLQIQKDRKLGPALVRARWLAVEKFLASNGHITMLELCQAPPVERYLHDLLQYALGILHIVTLVPYSRKLIVNATLSNDRVGIAVILDAANGSGYANPEIIQPALNVLVNLVCPPPSISNKPPLLTQGQQCVSVQSSNGPADRNTERNNSDRAVHVPSQNEPRERNAESTTADRGSAAVLSSQSTNSNSQTALPTVASGLVGDRRITLGAGAGCAGLAAQLEQGYRQAREAVRANNGIKVLLHLLQPRIMLPPAVLDCIRALACRVLLGLARDDTIAHILTKLQVGKKLSELLRDSGSQTIGTEQGRWQAELAQVAIELIAIVTNSGRASTLAATDAATPTLRRIERAAIAAATPISYHSRELLLLIHEHLQASGMATTAATLLKEAQLTPLPSLAASSSLVHQASMQEAPMVQFQWPSGRSPCGFLTDKPKSSSRDERPCLKCDTAFSSLGKKPVFSPSFSFQSRTQPTDSQPLPIKGSSVSKRLSTSAVASESPRLLSKSDDNLDSRLKTPITPIILPMKRKLTELKDSAPASSMKRINSGEHGLRPQVCLTPSSIRKSNLWSDSFGFSSPSSSMKEQLGRSAPGGTLADSMEDNAHMGMMTPSSVNFGLGNDPQPGNQERLTLDSLVVQYLKHQHRQCPAPITTLPPLSLLHPHICPEPRRSMDAPLNVTARLRTREFRCMYGGMYGNRRDRQFVYSRFRPWRICRDDNGALLTCIASLGDSSQIVVGIHSGEIMIFDANSSKLLESCTAHQSPLTIVQSYLSGETQLVLSSSSHDVRLWDAFSISGGPIHSFDECKAARFSNSGSTFAALPSDSSQKKILLYDIQTYHIEQTLLDMSTSSGRAHMHSQIHFSPSDSMLLWNGVLWDRRGSGPVHRFDQFTDYGGGGFHPAGNEVIINSEVWDLRKFRLLRSVPSLDQTVITFNTRGDVIYAILRRNIEDITSAVNTRRCKHPLFAAFRTVDAVNYSDIATFPVDRCVLDFATEPTDSFVGLVTMDDQENMYSSARVYEIGRKKPTDDDSDPDDAESEEEDDEDDDEDADEDSLLGPDMDGDGESDPDDLISNEEDSVSELDDDDDDGDFLDEMDFDGGGRFLEIVTDGDEDDNDSQLVESFSSGDEDDFGNNGLRF
ncbi:hypothetical protein RJ641_022002 [Dillenia turbinata]|uniref:LisH domain-containing protein n=1 Tax=Dillenia turbinata TaxID=194707 RepID=A0AAN8UJP4_9MAGN